MMLATGLSRFPQKVLSNLRSHSSGSLRKFRNLLIFLPTYAAFVKASSMSGRLDRTDLKILRLLQNNGRLANDELAEKVGVSAATCHRRTQRLFEDGFIGQV